MRPLAGVKRKWTLDSGKRESLDLDIVECHYHGRPHAVCEMHQVGALRQALARRCLLVDVVLLCIVHAHQGFN
jgi:hypothetical protein